MIKDSIVDPGLYDEKYFLSDNEGWREWREGLYGKPHSKFRRAIELAGDIRGKNILDVGCGRGEIVYYCAKDCASALGIDYSPVAIDIARKTLDRLDHSMRAKVMAETALIEDYKFTKKYDVIFMIEMVEHIYDWQFKKAIDNIRSVMNPGGKLIIMTPNYLYEKWFSPIKRLVNIPFNMVKWPLRILRGKYRPASLRELAGKIFKVSVSRGELNKKMHVNVMTRRKIVSYLKDFDAKVYCADHSKNLLSFIVMRWFGRDIEAVAVKR